MDGSAEKMEKVNPRSGRLSIEDASDTGGDRPMHAMTLGHLTQVVFLAMGSLAVFESEGLLNWTLRLPTGRIGDFIVSTAGAWHDLMTSIGATQVHIALRAAFLWFSSLNF